MRRQPSSISQYRGLRRQKFSVLLLTGILVPVILTLVAAAVFVLPLLQTHAAKGAVAVNGDCSLIVPPDPLTAQGLSTPYQLVATHRKNGPCHEANPLQAAFVQAAVIDPASGKISIYDPLVIDKGTQPAVTPVVPTLPQGGIVGIWFGFNGNNLILKSSNGSLQAGNCVNGADGTIFGQFSYCNAPAFFQAANQAIQAKKLTPPPLGMAKDGMTCPTVRDFSVVDQDQSDNVTTTYLLTAGGQIAQMTATNAANLQNALPLGNGSDNRLLVAFIDNALGCHPWMAPDLASPGKMLTALPLDELQAAAHQNLPVALVPNGDPMVLNNNNIDLAKLNAYRVGVDQLPLTDNSAASTKAYCTSLRLLSPKRMLLDAPLTIAGPSPDPMVANSLLTFLEQRFVTTYGANGLNCRHLLKLRDPISVKINGAGVAINGTINGVVNGLVAMGN